MDDNLTELTQAKTAIVPKWCNHDVVPDPEVLVLICQEMLDRMPIDVEDSRVAQNILIEAALMFDELHASNVEDYWMHKDILDEIEIFCEKVEACVRRAGPKWYNDVHHMMYGKSHLRDVYWPNAPRDEYPS